MGGVMGAPMYGWMLLYGLLGLVFLVGGGFVMLRVIGRRSLPPGRSSAGSDAAQAEAQMVLRRRYAAGEISREEYLQGKVELED
jgi:putative membrane protein